MPDFKAFKKVVYTQFTLMTKHEMFRSAVDKDALWKMYLASFPEGTNPMYRERTEHDCSCCKNFIRAVGNAIAIIRGKQVSVWDVKIGGHYQVVADAMSKMVKEQALNDVFLHFEKKVGTDRNREISDKGKLLNTWEHFYFELPAKFVCKGDDIATELSEKRTAKEVFFRGLTEITADALRTVSELIAQGSLYRGEEHKRAISMFTKEKTKFDTIKTAKDRENFSWLRSAEIGGASRFRNSVIGTLLTDLSTGVDLEKAVGSFEAKVAPSNYKRPTALITHGMIDQAKKKVIELGIGTALPRRFAVSKDVTANNVLYVDRKVKATLGDADIFAEMSKEVKSKPKKLDKVEEVSIDDFVDNIMPTADSIEVLFMASQINNLVSLVAPVDATAKNILKWNNNLSWSYNGEVTDSLMKDRVKKAGGKVDGVLRLSLQWNDDGKDSGIDFDAHCREPKGNLISYESKDNHSTSGNLDVDITSPGRDIAVENITWSDIRKMDEGIYHFIIHNYSSRNSQGGFSAEVEHNGTIHSFHYNKALKGKEKVTVAKIKFSRDGELIITDSLSSSEVAAPGREEWGVNTNQFQKVSMVMKSPNHWDENEVGNKHWFFMLDGCKNPEEARGLYNEFLSEDLTEHRKVFEIMGAKMKAEVSEDQLSGLGFSSTQRNSVTCRVSGSFQRTVKVKF